MNEFFNMFWQTVKALFATKCRLAITVATVGLMALSVANPEGLYAAGWVGRTLKMVITAVAVFGLVVGGRMALPRILTEREGDAKESHTADRNALFTYGGRLLSAAVGITFLVGVLWIKDAFSHPGFYTMLASVAMLSTILVAAVHLSVSVAQAEYARWLLEATREQSEKLAQTSEILEGLESVIGEMDNKGIVSLTDRVGSLLKPISRGKRGIWFLFWAVVSLLGITVYGIFF